MKRNRLLTFDSPSLAALILSISGEPSAATEVQVSATHSFLVVNSSVEFSVKDMFSIRDIHKTLSGTDLKAKFYQEKSEEEPISIIVVSDSNGELLNIYGDAKTQKISEIYSESKSMTDYNGVKIGDRLTDAVESTATCHEDEAVVCSPTDDPHLRYYLDMNFDCGKRLVPKGRDTYQTTDCYTVSAISILP